MKSQGVAPSSRCVMALNGFGPLPWAHTQLWIQLHSLPTRCRAARSLTLASRSWSFRQWLGTLQFWLFCSLIPRAKCEILR